MERLFIRNFGPFFRILFVAFCYSMICGSGCKNPSKGDANEYGARVSDVIAITDGLTSYFKDYAKFPESYKELESFIYGNTRVNFSFAEHWDFYLKSSMSPGEIVAKERIASGSTQREPMAVVFTGDGRFEYRLRWNEPVGAE